MRLHHVQVSCPPDGEEAARRFYVDGLGLAEVDKPPALAARGGCWFRAYDDLGATVAEIHVGVEQPFTPARKAHPALAVEDERALERVAARLRAAGHDVDDAERSALAGHIRFHTADPHGNRVEVLAPVGLPRPG
jgi:catechol 2,3-dioxygenase-like lactoylglutathione lyase family enzyme